MKISFSMSFRDKERFFDRQAIIDSVEPAFHSYLMQGGALVRKIAQRSIRRGGKKRKPSDPGKPPKHHLPGSNEGLRRIIYTLSSDKMSADIGPVKYERASKPTVPALHEFGGMAPGLKTAIGPTARTQWMFEPANVQKYQGLHNRLKRLENFQNRSKFKLVVNDKQVYTVQDFMIQTVTIMAKMPPRPFMEPALNNPDTQKKLQGIWSREIGKKIKQGIRWSKSRGR